jgi:hypothetical protein
VAYPVSCLCCCVGAAARDKDIFLLRTRRYGVYMKRSPSCSAVRFLLCTPMAVPLLLVNAGFWIGCTTTDSSVEGTYSVTMLVVGLLQMIYYAWLTWAFAEEYETALSVVAGVIGCICIALVVAAGLLTDATLIHGGAYLSSCGDEAPELEAAAGSSSEALMFDDCCSGTEPTVYATIALLTAGLSCLCCCVGADKVDDTDDQRA